MPGGIQALKLYDAKSDLASACAFVQQQGAATVAVPYDTCKRSKYLLFLEGSGVQVV